MNHIFALKTDEKYYPHIVAHYTKIEDAELHKGMLEEADRPNYDYLIIPIKIDINVEKLRKGYRTFHFSRHEKNGKVTMRLTSDNSFKESYMASERMGEQIKILARDKEEAKKIFGEERKRLKNELIQLAKENPNSDYYQNLVKNINKYKIYYCGEDIINECREDFDTSIGPTNIF